MKRKKGYYWVKVESRSYPPSWEVAFWDGSSWNTCGSDEPLDDGRKPPPFDDPGVVEVGERLVRKKKC